MTAVLLQPKWSEHWRVRTLVKALGEEDSPEAYDALWKMGPAAVPALVEALGDKNDRRREAAAGVLSNIGPKAKGAVPNLIEILQDRNHVGRHHAAFVLAHIGPEARRAVPVLIGVLADENVYVRRGAVLALGNIGGDAKSAKAALAKMMQDEDPPVREWTVSALCRIDSHDDVLAPLLTGALKDQQARVRTQAALALADIGRPMTALPVLIEAVESKDAELSIQAVRALASVGPAAKEAVPALIEATHDRETCTYAPISMDLDAPPDKQLLTITGGEAIYLWQEAAEALRSIDPDAAASAGLSGSR